MLRYFPEEWKCVWSLYRLGCPREHSSGLFEDPPEISKTVNGNLWGITLRISLHGTITVLLFILYFCLSSLIIEKISMTNFFIMFDCRVYNAIHSEPSFVLILLHVISIPLTGNLLVLSFSHAWYKIMVQERSNEGNKSVESVDLNWWNFHTQSDWNMLIAVNQLFQCFQQGWFYV